MHLTYGLKIIRKIHNALFHCKWTSEDVRVHALSRVQPDKPNTVLLLVVRRVCTRTIGRALPAGLRERKRKGGERDE
jgi:hypothetical protein